jgi:hypothetical protein
MTHGFLNHKESTGCVDVNQRFPADFETNEISAPASNWLSLANRVLISFLSTKKHFKMSILDGSINPRHGRAMI